MRNFLLFSLLIQMFAPLNMLAMRMNYYYIIFIPLLLPRIIACASVRYRSVAAWARNIMLVFFFVHFFARANSGINLHTIPYHFFWEHYSRRSFKSTPPAVSAVRGRSASASANC